MTRRARLVLSSVAIAGAVAGLLAAGAVHLVGSKPGGLSAVGQVISAAQRPLAPDISGTTLTSDPDQQHQHAPHYRYHAGQRA